MARETLFGYAGGTPTSELTDTIAGGNYSNAFSGPAVATDYEVYSLQSGYVKCGLYEWVGTYPMLSRDLNNTGTSVAADQWNEIEFSLPYAMESGGYYRSMAGGSVSGAVSYSSSGSSSPRYADFDYGTGLPAEYNLTTSTGNDYAVRVLGYYPPIISSVDSDDSVTVGQTGATISGLNLLDSAGQPTIELCNNADYGSATVRVTQANSSCTDTAGEFDVVQGDLVADTTVYVFVTTGLGQRNTTGFTVTIAAVSVSVDGDGQAPTVSQGDATVAVSVSVDGAGQSPTAGQGDATASVPVSVDGAGQSPTVGQGDATVSAGVSVSGTGQDPTLEQGGATATVGTQISADGDGQTPTVGQGGATASVPVSVDGDGQTPTVDQGDASASVPVSVDGDGQSPTVGQGDGDAVIGTPASVDGDGQSPTVGQGDASASVPVLATGEGQTPTVGQGDASASVPVSVDGDGQSPTVGQGDGDAPSGFPVSATGEGQSPTVGQGDATVNFDNGPDTVPGHAVMTMQAFSGTINGTSTTLNSMVVVPFLATMEIAI